MKVQEGRICLHMRGYSRTVPGEAPWFMRLEITAMTEFP
jgi:hypothetical protein